MHICGVISGQIKNCVRIAILLLLSLILAIVVNTFHPLRLPLLLTDGKRPGIPVGKWNELRYINARDAFNEVSAQQGILIDVRDTDDFSESHASGAVNLSYHEFDYVYPKFTEEVSDDRHLYIFCHGKLCGISVRVAERLLDLGFKNITIIKQDFEDWKASNLPVEKKGSEEM